MTQSNRREMLFEKKPKKLNLSNQINAVQLKHMHIHTNMHIESIKCSWFSFPSHKYSNKWLERLWGISIGEMLFNFCSHPSLYIPMTLLKVFSYWQMWQHFGNKSWAKSCGPKLSWHDSQHLKFTHCTCVIIGTDTTKNNSTTTSEVIVNGREIPPFSYQILI